MPDHGTTQSPDDRLRENRLRQRATRQGLMVSKSRSRNPEVSDYGTFGISDDYTKLLVHGDPETGFGLSLDEVESLLSG